MLITSIVSYAVFILALAVFILALAVFILAVAVLVAVTIESSTRLPDGLLSPATVLLSCVTLVLFLLLVLCKRQSS